MFGSRQLSGKFKGYLVMDAGRNMTDLGRPSMIPRNNCMRVCVWKNDETKPTRILALGLATRCKMLVGYAGT